MFMNFGQCLQLETYCLCKLTPSTHHPNDTQPEICAVVGFPGLVLHDVYVAGVNRQLSKPLFQREHAHVSIHNMRDTATDGLGQGPQHADHYTSTAQLAYRGVRIVQPETHTHCWNGCQTPGEQTRPWWRVCKRPRQTQALRYT